MTDLAAKARPWMEYVRLLGCTFTGLSALIGIPVYLGLTRGPEAMVAFPSGLRLTLAVTVIGFSLDVARSATRHRREGLAIRLARTEQSRWWHFPVVALLGPKTVQRALDQAGQEDLRLHREAMHEASRQRLLTEALLIVHREQTRIDREG